MGGHYLTALMALGACVLFLRTRKELRLGQFLLSAAAGVASLLAANYLGAVFRFPIPLNAFSLALAAVGGVPGTALYNLLFVLFR